MERTHGTWGVRTVTYEDRYHIVTILELDPDQRCSWHFHRAAYNQFYVIKGRVGIRTNCGPKELCRTTIVHPGQSFLVPPNKIHEFITYNEPAIMEEIAFVQYDPSDIERLRLGGAREDARNE